MPVNFHELQRAEEAARQRSNITSLQGNSIPWYVERRPRAESLEHVIRQQARDRAVEEEHQRLRSLYLPSQEEPVLKATGTPNKKKDAPKGKGKNETAQDAGNNADSKGAKPDDKCVDKRGGEGKGTHKQKPTR